MTLSTYPLVSNQQLPTTIPLTEYQPTRFPADYFSMAQAEFLWRHHRHQVVVEPPSFKTNGEWQLTAQGWIGFIPLARDVTLALQPKVPISNLFEMMGYAYGLDEIDFGTYLVEAATLDSFVDRLAYRLAALVGKQQMRGLSQAYAESVAGLPFIRGQIELHGLLGSPTASSAIGSEIVCRYDELTFDTLENQIVLWTLHLLGRSAACSAETKRACRRCTADLHSAVSLRPCRVDECEQVQYSRLNQSYRPIIALCRFLLQGCIPAIGQPYLSPAERAEPFLINSAQLFERYVAAWLTHHLDSQMQLRVQERRAIGNHDRLHFAIDLALYDSVTGTARCVMDTKYKLPAATPDTADIAQVVAYAEAIGAPEAVLIYPATIAEPLDVQIGQIRVRSLAFDLAPELTASGHTLLANLCLAKAAAEK